MAAMKLRSGKIEVTSPSGFPRGAWLQIDVGENAEYTQVLGVRGTTVKIGRVRWWRRTLWWLQARPAAIGGWARRQMCAVAGHRVTRESYGTRHCWCRKRREDGADWDDAMEWRP
jgi:hypothetical protein